MLKVDAHMYRFELILVHFLAIRLYHGKVQKFVQALRMSKALYLLEENAILKAEALAKELGTIVIADDSGLAVDALNGEPGVYSARYAGDHDDEANMIKLLENLQGVEYDKRTARFCCCIAIAGPDQTVSIGSVVTLAGNATGSVTNYQWEQISGFPVQLTNANTSTATFTFPAQSTTLSFRLTVSGP